MERTFLKSNTNTSHLLLRIGDGLEDICFTLENSRLVMKVGIDDARTILWRQEQVKTKRILQQLKEKKLIKIKKLSDKYETTLTDNGMIEYLRLKLIHCDKLPSDEVTMVIFDIPESQKHIRKQLRRFLEQICFMPIQKSVWISQFDSAQILSKIFKLNKRQNWIQVFNARRINK